jgi:hypothetical protein
MFLEVLAVTEALAAELARVSIDAGVHVHVTLEVVGRGECLAALRALVTLLKHRKRKTQRQWQ